jgi:hypothetical protein
MERLFDSDAASRWLADHGISRSPKTLRKLRCTGGGPRFRYFGNKPVYDEAALIEWVRARLSEPVENSSEAV